MSELAAVFVDGLVKRYAGRAVVDGLSLTAPLGAVTAVLGPNGAGKTTTIECCEGLRAPDGGSIQVLGLDPQTDAKALRPRVGVMLQDGGLPNGARAMEMLRHVAAMYADPLDVNRLAERLGVDAFARTTVRRLSGGQRQRLSLAIAVVGRPEVVFLDEPSAGMDPQSRHAVWNLVAELRSDGVGIVLTTHLMDEAETLADVVYIVDHGQVIAHGTTASLLAANAKGETQTIRLLADPGLDHEKIALALATPDGGWAVDESKPGTYAISGPVTPGSLADLAQWLANEGVLATDIAVGRRTLEDVFLDLTGRSLR